MPTRQLKPGLCHSKRYNRCSWPAQSLYTRLIMHVDDHARYAADSELLASVLFPYGCPRGRRVRAADLETWLAELVQADLLSIYTVAGSRYLLLHRWTERVRSANSRFPSPPADICQQMPATAVSRPQPAANAALPTSSPSSTTTPSTEREIGAHGGSVLASRTQVGALLAKIRDLDKVPRSERTPDQRENLKKMRADLERIQSQQANGEFPSP